MQLSQIKVGRYYIAKDGQILKCVPNSDWGNLPDDFVVLQFEGGGMIPMTREKMIKSVEPTRKTWKSNKKKKK